MKTLIKLIIAYVALISTFVLLLYLSHAIPGKYIAKNTKESAKTIQKEGLYPKFLNFKLFQLDGFTDALMLNIAISVDSENPLLASMVNNHFHSDNFFELAVSTEKVANGNTENLTKTSYGRYWQGYLSFLRPALCFINYQKIRILNFILLFSLLFTACYLILKRISKKVMLVFLMALLLINFPIIPFSMQFSTVFYIALISIIIILYFREKLESQDHFLLLFFTIGACTSFFDFLTVPIVTLGLPLTIYILSSPQELNKISLILKGSLIWGIGYVLSWASKWIIGGYITGIDILSDALHWEAVRTSSMYKGTEMTIPKIIAFIWEPTKQMHLEWLVYTSFFVILIAIVLYLFLLKSKNVLKQNVYLLFIVAMVPAWYLLLRNHSMEHGWMTWRAIVVSIFAGLIFILNTTSLKRLTSKIFHVSK